MKKVLIWILVAVLATVFVAGVMWFRGRQQQAQEAEKIVRTAQITRGALEITVAASGNVMVAQRSDLRFKMPGEVVTVTVEVSDRVKRGQVLAYLDAEDLEMAIRQAEIALEQVQLSMDILQQPVDENDLRLADLSIQDAAQSMEVARLSREAAEAQTAFNVRIAQEIRDKTEDAYLQYEAILEKYGLPASYGAGANVAYIEADGNVGITQVKGEEQIEMAKSQWLAAYYAYEQAKRSLEKLQAGADADQVQQIELQIEQARLSLVQARESLSNTVLIAPHDGVVAAVNLQVGSLASSAVPAITLLDDRELFVDVTVDEVDVGKVAEGLPVKVTLDAYPGVTLEGEIVRIATLPTPVAGVVSYPLRVRLLRTSDVDVRDGMTASVVVNARRLDDVVLAPNWAVRTDQTTGEIYVYLYDAESGIPERIPVTTGAWNETFTQIISGVEPGATVALVVEERNLLEMQGPPSGQ
ncbi:MAG: efflux RND transporter periplasmic adaptor subunit [Anaerolineae bacterium]|nr:efflux RND transporter periplasmic adaptor subunit [Anaerolineae bacterium]